MGEALNTGGYDYRRDGADIYAESLRIIRAEAELARFPADVEQVVVRMCHAAGDVTIADEVAFSPQVVTAGRAALAAGAPILCDSTMVATGIIRSRLPRGNDAVSYTPLDVYKRQDQKERGIAGPGAGDRHREGIGAQGAQPAMSEQQRLEEQHHRPEEGHHRGPEQHRPQARPGRMRRAPGHRGQLHRRKNQGEGAGSGQQQAVLRILAGFPGDRPGPVDHEGGGGDEPCGAMTSGQKALGDVHGTLSSPR